MRVSCTAWHDWFVEGATSALFVDDRVLVMSELATEMLRLVGDGCDVDDLARRLGEVFGEPDNGLEEETRTRVLELVSTGVLQVEDVEAP